MRKLNCPHFTLGESLTPDQRDFFNRHGVIIFRNFINPETVQLFIREVDRIEKQWLAEDRDKVNGVPLKFGQDEAGNTIIQRMCFLSQYSNALHEFLQDPRLQTVVELLHPYEGRIGEVEKDGLILNHYVRTPNSKFSQMGWHTDSPRDIFLGQRIMPMLNVGIHLNSTPFESGGLRVIPGTHRQGIFRMLFRKRYFVDNNPDKDEVGFDINAGDLTVHDGRLWHRAQQSPYFGEASRRRVMYVPVVTGKYMPKDENSKTPFYHRFISKVNI
ncbi:phytanoyl-CoA dioxygenase [Fibrisoma montanum]|uniref:Phytanoyl-CoA dioxygenase n=1 Tax=Fibrisoma montanum TaxID=2305895 RepID=A0A418M3V8_9BACT|nr:phytanoyl-CoA dioxygenase family protein [Fibrisoma montanum]RIV20448.1 phytanoyl-CoA dioxygenase [Fibrisoma montanum]